MYNPRLCGWDHVPAVYYAQCQLTMMALECNQISCTRMLLVQYLPEQTIVYMVAYSKDWIRKMIARLADIKQNVLDAGDLSRMDLMQETAAYDDLLRCTRERCAECKQIAKLPSINFQGDSEKIFLG